jgi:enamine deaminase RidA (YjgF/YER057c/UK114 family)
VTGEPEVTDVFAALERVLRAGGSDMRHLVKATYCVSADDSSVALNALRPRYYDPARPPAASKAAVAGVGQSGRGLLIDMIAVPTLDP